MPQTLARVRSAQDGLVVGVHDHGRGLRSGRGTIPRSQVRAGFRGGGLPLMRAGVFGGLDTRASVVTSFCTVGPLLALSAVWLVGVLREFPGPDGEVFAFFYLQIPGAAGARVIDLVGLAIGLIGWEASLLAFRKSPPLPTPLCRSVLLFGLAVGLSVALGLIRGGAELFFDWRNIAIAVAVFPLCRYTVSRLGPSRVVSWWLIMSGLWAGFLLMDWATNGGVPPYGGPLWDGPALSGLVSAAVLGAARLISPRGERVRIIEIATPLLCSLVVLTALRRTYWLELFIAIVILFFLRGGRRGRLMALFAVVIALVVISPQADKVVPRLNSLHLSASGEFAETNQDHLNEVLDAIDAVKKEPLLGLGQGIAFETPRISNWKDISWGVHNAPLHVWLRYGLLGLLAYAGFHLTLLRWLLRHRSLFVSVDSAIVSGILAYWFATFVVSLAFSPWPYGALQNTSRFALLLALAASARATHPASQ